MNHSDLRWGKMVLPSFDFGEHRKTSRNLGLSFSPNRLNAYLDEQRTVRVSVSAVPVTSKCAGICGMSRDNGLKWLAVMRDGNGSEGLLGIILDLEIWFLCL